jgi:hypothetical protein
MLAGQPYRLPMFEGLQLQYSNFLKSELSRFALGFSAFTVHMEGPYKSLEINGKCSVVYQERSPEFFDFYTGLSKIVQMVDRKANRDPRLFQESILSRTPHLYVAGGLSETEAEKIMERSIVIQKPLVGSAFGICLLCFESGNHRDPLKFQPGWTKDYPFRGSDEVKADSGLVLR